MNVRVSTVAIKEHYFSSMGEVHSVDVFYTSNKKLNNPCMCILKLAAASDSRTTKVIPNINLFREIKIAEKLKTILLCT